MKKMILAILLSAAILFGASFALQGVAAKKAQEEKAKAKAAKKAAKKKEG